MQFEHITLPAVGLELCTTVKLPSGQRNVAATRYTCRIGYIIILQEFLLRQ